MAVNWTELFSGFSDVGTAIGDFVTNLLTGLLPAFIIMAVIALVMGAIAAVGVGIVMLVRNTMKSVGKSK